MNGSGVILGYYTICSSSVPTNGLRPEMRKKFPYALAPVYLIGRLAVDRNIQGRGEGSNLLLDALYRCYRISEHAAGVGVIVDAKDDHARGWYLKFGFIPFADDAMRLFLPMQTIGQLIETAHGAAATDAKPVKSHSRGEDITRKL